LTAEQSRRQLRKLFQKTGMQAIVVRRLMELVQQDRAPAAAVNAAALILAHDVGKPVARVEQDVRVTKTISVQDRRASILERLAQLQREPIAIECEVVQPADDLADGAGI
jgi:hypothetical protein